MLIVLILLLNSFVYASCSDDILTLEKFYEASKNEDYDAYISLMDTDYIYEYLAEEEYYRYYVEAAWEVYNTIDYELDIIKCNEIPGGSIIFLEVDSKIESEGETFDIERIYAAVFENGKIQFVMDHDTFAYHQNLAYTAMYFNDTKDIMKDTFDEAEKIIDYYENFEMPEKKGFSWFFILFLVGMAGLIPALVYYRHNSIILIKKTSKRTGPLTNNILTFFNNFYKNNLKPFSKNFFRKLKVFYKNHLKPFFNSVVVYTVEKIIPVVKKFFLKLKEFLVLFYKNKFLPFLKTLKKNISSFYDDKINHRKKKKVKKS